VTVDLEASRKEKENESVIQRKEVDTLSSRIPVDRWYTYSKEKGVDIVSSRTSNPREDKEKRVDTASSSIPMDIWNEPTIPCKKQPTTKFTTTSENLNVASDSSSDAPDFLSTPFPNTQPCHGMLKFLNILLVKTEKCFFNFNFISNLSDIFFGVYFTN